MADFRARRARERVAPQEGGGELEMSGPRGRGARSVLRAALLVALGAGVITPACVGYETPADPDDDPDGLAPPTPAGIAIEPGPSVNAITLNWPFVLSAQAYNIYWGTTPDLATSSSFKISSVVPPFIHSGLTPGTTYYYMVSSVTAAGDEGVPTTIISGMPRATIGLKVESPTAGALIDDPFEVVLSYSAPEDPGPMSAIIGGVTATVTYDASISRYRGMVDLSPVASPSAHRLVVRANGPDNEVAEATISVRFDRKPVLEVIAPADQLALTPSSRIFVTCADDADGGCTVLLAYVAGFAETPLIAGRSEINANLLSLLGGYSSGPLSLVIEGRDTAGQIRRVTRTVILP